MADFPAQREQTVLTINTANALAPEMAVIFGSFAIRTSAVWPSANLAIFVPFIMNSIMPIVKMGVHNGSAVSGNIDIGVYDASGNRLVSAGSTASSGTSVNQIIDTTDVTLYPGLYYMAQAADNTTVTNTAYTGLGVNSFRTMGVLQMASAFPLPSTATFAALGQAYVPTIFLSSRTTI